jgi:DNA repair protein RadC
MPVTALPLFPAPAEYKAPRVKRLPLREQPGYRVAQNPTACNLAELLSALIGGGKQIETAEALLAHFDGDLRRLYQAHPSELAQVRGIKQATAVRIKAALNLGLRLSLPPDERPAIKSPADAAALVQPEMGLLEKEHLRVMLLDTRNRVIDVVEICQGSVNSAHIRIGEVMRPAIQRMATAMIVIHNHPSNDPTPSPDDAAITRAILQAAKLLDIDILDHLVVCQSRWVSLKERGLGFT